MMKLQYRKYHRDCNGFQNKYFALSSAFKKQILCVLPAVFRKNPRGQGPQYGKSVMFEQKMKNFCDSSHRCSVYVNDGQRNENTRFLEDSMQKERYKR